jgi:predicted nucleic acid-binding protein
VLTHPFVIGEIACGSLADRTVILELLANLPKATAADDGEALAFIERHRLHGKGLGYVDVHLLAAVALTPGVRVWTRDKRLDAAAQALGCAHVEEGTH